MSTATTLSTRLLEQKARFLEDGGAGWTIVMGNEAGDLDSLASSIGFAWLLSHIPVTENKAIALITTARKDFVLRAENIYALQIAGIKEGFRELLCPEDLPTPNLSASFALVDHNSLQPSYASPGVRVTAIVDHHEDEGKHLDTASPRIIEPVGSCASLVTRVIMSYPTLEIPTHLAVLLLSAIVIDTHGLRKGGKAVDVDYQASAWLLARANVVASGNLGGHIAQSPEHVHDQPWIQSLSNTLSTKKSAVSQLTTRDLLRRDYKEYLLDVSAAMSGDGHSSIKAGLATVPLPLSTFFSPSPTSTVAATREWIQERDLAILGVLTTYKNKRGKSRRELMWVVEENATGARLPQAFFKGFEANEVLQAKRTNFERYGFGGQAGRNEKGQEEDGDRSDDEKESVGAVAPPFGEGVAARVYKQKNLAATRKQLAPILKQLLEG